ncbi:unnamed protein product [Lampetra planeri]
MGVIAVEYDAACLLLMGGVDDCRSRQQQGHGAIALRERDSPAKEDEWKTSGPPLTHPRGVTSSSKVKSFRLWLL